MHRDLVVTDGEIRFHGVFDAPAARRVEAAIARVRPRAQLRVDLTHVREFHDAAIGVLASALSSCAADVAVRGLRHHQIRMLRYFGVDAAPLEAGPARGQA